MQIRNEKEKKFPLWVLLPHKAIGAIFGAIAAVTFVASLALPLTIKTPILITYVVMNITMMIGFWGMRKWIVALSGITLGGLIINDIIRLFSGAQVTSAMINALVVAGALLVFTFITRKWLDGSYDDRHPFRVFITALVVSQVLTFFL